MKGVFIGIDGLDYQLLTRNVHWNLNNLQRFLNQGYAALCRPEVAYSPPSWTTIYTGVGVKKHGVQMVPFQPGSEELDNKTFAELDYPCLWDYLNNAGLSCGLFSMPLTWPAKRIDGWMVSGWPAPRLSFTPSDLPLIGNNMLLDAASVFRVSTDEPWAQHGSPHKVVDWICESERQKFQRALKLPEQDVLFLGITLIDRIGDICKRWVETEQRLSRQQGKQFFKRAYRVMDDLLGDITRKLEADVWAIVSDHGHRAFRHKFEGVFAIHGNGIRRQRSRCTAFDVAPSFLDALDVPYTGMPFEGTSQITKQGDEAAILKRLEGLGYI